MFFAAQKTYVLQTFFQLSRFYKLAEIRTFLPCFDYTKNLGFFRHHIWQIAILNNALFLQKK